MPEYICPVRCQESGQELNCNFLHAYLHSIPDRKARLKDCGAYFTSVIQAGLGDVTG